ncbi:hypothetical protein LTS07_006825 [Exophiala sideris]|uniref:Uncharacterized protein n=1 Tax=Exophiala sideris TaxID=1016849 RepID=A0ABR0J8Q8_9EURO|nr:hypothetical protein LTS07_006825 [Exophiala sideris]KAK5037460.1 hypothetical protein LTR13_004617 [Exophiala sideris]KAK5059121.1 hypothetical protein LTR69_006410 [Exophiala sideris]KAK5182955.1 hypothetical protein LTR44_004665 [Eurotiomycetes sp. CCFEE 6388]
MLPTDFWGNAAKDQRQSFKGNATIVDHNSIAGENLLKAEDKVSELHVEITSLDDQVLHAHRERDEAQVRALRERIVALEQEKREAVDGRTEVSAELERVRSEYTPISETMTSFHHDTEDLEQDIETLQALVCEAQEQRERDTYISRYDDKCRELERLRESLRLRRTARYSHNNRRSSRGLTTSSCTVTSPSVSHLKQHSSGHESGMQHMNSTLSAAVDHSPAETPLEASVDA